MVGAPGRTGLAISSFATSMVALTRGTDIALSIVMAFGNIHFTLLSLHLGHRQGSFGRFTTGVLLTLTIFLLFLQGFLFFLLFPFLA
jgi:hypothetical protein